MANPSQIPGTNPLGRQGQGGAAMTADTDLPPSLPLQIFLLCAFLVTVAAYLADQWTHRSSEATAARTDTSRAEDKGKYLAYTKLGFLAEDQRHYDVAISNFHNAVLIQNTGEAHYNLGNALLKQSRFNEAFAQFQAALKQSPKPITVRDIYTSWGQALMNQGKPAEAAQLYRDSAARSPGFSLTHFQLALALEAQKKTTEALEEYTRAAKLGLDAPDFYSHFGALLNQQRKYAEAEPYLKKAVGMLATQPDAQYQLAWAQQEQGEYADAIGHYNTMLTQTPDHPATLNNLALIYATATNAAVHSPKMAVLLATRAAAATQEKNALFLDTLARSYAADGDFAQAVTWENKAIERAKQQNDQPLVDELTRRYTLFQQQKTE